MQVNGVPPKGKELELFPGLTLHLPFGIAYARDEDGSMNLLKPRTSPKLYRDGPFELDDEAETTWKLNSLRSVFSGTIEAPRANAAKAVEENMEDIAKGLTEDQDQSESDEDRYTFGTEEGEDGLTFQANFSTAQAGGSYEKPVTKGNVTLCVVHQRMRVMRFHITVSHLLIGVVDYPQMRYYLAGLGIPDEDRRGEILEKELFPLLYTLQFTAPPNLFDLLGKKPEELFPAAVQGLDFAAGEQVEAGEFTVTIPKGLHYTRTENPETRLFTAVPQEIPFDAEDFWDYSAIALTLQTGAPIVNIHAPLDTADGDKEVELILQAMNISDSSSAGQTAVGKTTRAARSPDHYICYELLDDNDVDMNFRYYVFTKNFLYVGQYVGKKAGLGSDYSKTHTGILETYLKGFRYTGGSEKLLEDAGRRALGRFAGSDGRMDALKAVQLFNLDVLFFPDGAFSWDGTHHVFTGIHLNAEKMEEYPDVKDHLEEIGKAMQALVNECEQDERLRVPAAKLGAGLRNFLNGADLTGAALFHLAGYHLFWFKEDEETPGQFSLLIDARLKASVPDAENYFKRLLEIFRAYNGDPAPVVSGPARIFRAVDIPDIFEDGGPCLAETDEAEVESRQQAIQCLTATLQTVAGVKSGGSPVPAKPAKPAAGAQDLGRFAGDDGRLDAFMGVAFFTEDVIFFHPEDLLWDGKHHSFANYRFNAAVLPNAEGVLEHREAIVEGLKALIQELEENPELRVPAEDLHPEMRRFLKGADFTPAVVFYMECFNFFRFWEEEPDQYQFRLEERLANSFYDEATNGGFFEKFIGALRTYNGNHRPYTASFGGTYGGQTGEHLPDIKVYQYEMDKDGFPKEDENGDVIYRTKTSEELAWEARMAKKAAEAELAKVPFDRVSSVTVSGSVFVLTGDFEKNPEDRDVVKRLIEAKGGRCTRTVSGKTNYLVIGALGGFGKRKIEHVQEQRAKGKTIKIIREADLMAALEGRTPPAPKPAPKPAPQPASKPAPQPAPTVQKDSEETAARARIIEPVLSAVPMTAAEINAALGTDYTALQVAVAVKLIPGVGTTTVKRRISTGGVNTEKDYTAYYLNAKNAKPSGPKAPASRTLASEPGFRMEEIEPKAGEEARFRVSIDLSDLLGGGDGSAAPSPKASPSPAAGSAVDVERQRREAAHRKVMDNAEQRRKEQEAAYNKAVEALKADVQKIIKEGRETADKQKEEVQSLQQKKSSAEQKLKQLGFFSFSEKKAVRVQIAQLAKEIREAEQKLEGLKREARKKAEETLEKHRLPPPPALLGGSKSASKSARRSASGDAAERAQKIEGVLSILPMTAKEINAALGTDYSAFQIANAVKFIPSAYTDKVFRIETDKDGNPMLREFTAYCIGILG